MSASFGRYELLDLLGKGGMAEVYRSRLQSPAGSEKILVIKRILPHFSGDPDFLRLFVNEAKIALPLTHGNITSVFEFGEVEGQYFLAMEYIRGQNLETILARLAETASPLPPTAALFIAAEVAKGLAYAHSFTSPHGDRVEVVHLDVSPQNVLVSYDGAVKLTDFGIAKLASAASDKVVRGKACYMAPEQLTRGEVDVRADVYGLGVLLYELLTGTCPLAGATEEESLAKAREGVTAKPSSLRPELEPLDSLVMRALAFAPGDRFSTAAELEVALVQALYALEPGYGSHQLARIVRELFAWELYEQTASGKPLRDKLLFEISKRSGVVDDVGERSELQEGKTVALLSGTIVAPSDDARRKRLLIGAALAGLLLVFGAGALVFGGGDAPEPVPSTAARGTGRISVNSWPSAQVLLDGKRLAGQTPLYDIEVPAGSHKLLFEHPEFGLRKTVEVEVPAGGERTIAVELDR